MPNECMTPEEMAQKYPDERLFMIDSNINGNTGNFKLLRKSYVLSFVIPFFLGIWCIFYLIGCTLIGPATPYDNRDVIFRRLSEDRGSYWAVKHDLSKALILAEQQNDKSHIDRIKKLHKEIYGSYYVDSHHIFEGENAIRKLKAYGYQIDKMDNGYKLTWIKTVPRETTTKDGTVVTGERIVDKIKDEWLIGLYGYFENGMGWAVDRDGKIWLAVPNRIVIRAN